LMFGLTPNGRNASLRQFYFSGEKEGDWGREFLPALSFPLSLFSLAPEIVFRKAKCAAKKEVAFASPTRAHTTILLPRNVE
jgi:hypothetical protein